MTPHRLSRPFCLIATMTPLTLLGCAHDCPPDTTGSGSQGGGGGPLVDAGTADAAIPFDFPPCKAGFTNLQGTWKGAPFERSIPSDPPQLQYSHYYLVNAAIPFTDPTGRWSGAEMRLYWDAFVPGTHAPTGFNGTLVFPNEPTEYTIHENSSLIGRWPVIVYRILLDEGTLTGCSQ